MICEAPVLRQYYTRIGPVLTCSLSSAFCCCWTTVPLFSALLVLVVLELLVLLMLLVERCLSEREFVPSTPELESNFSISAVCFSSSSSCFCVLKSWRRVVSWNIFNKTRQKPLLPHMLTQGALLNEKWGDFRKFQALLGCYPFSRFSRSTSMTSSLRPRKYTGFHIFQRKSQQWRILKGKHYGGIPKQLDWHTLSKKLASTGRNQLNQYGNNGTSNLTSNKGDPRLHYAMESADKWK